MPSLPNTNMQLLDVPHPHNRCTTQPQANNRKLVDFLSRNFDKPDARAAAAKNAYALLGQHK